MIVLDTQVVSEPMKLWGDPTVQAWLDRQVADTLYLTATSLAELLVGVATLPDGKRKEGLATGLNGLLAGLFAGRILSFDQPAAETYARLMVHARVNGRVISVAHGQIAAPATTHGFAVATRDVAPFVAPGVRAINPWTV
ncbi:MAG TPA: type II toxin-antitoxin system VapC family toxin [Acetobacteraceae bacterium]|jgi:predicted nucleic acid-binding protein|nr:type II toxin-antitoxin system VapC family toxin [Acetobacteraceae bacterium]